MVPPLDPDRILDELCRRHGVSRTFGERLRPLLDRARESNADARQRILALVERSFAQEAERVRTEARSEARVVERKMLSSVAAILHDWEPPDWLDKWSGDAEEGDGAPGENLD